MANKILNSGLFNEQAYLARYPDVAAGWKGTAEEHFLQYGANEGRIGNTNFDVTYLRSTYADLSGMTAAQLYTWYNQYGYAENRVTSSALASFDAAKYLADNADLGKGGVTANSALAHYLMFGVTEGRAAYNTSGVAYTVANGTVSTGTGGNEAGKETVLTTAQDILTGTAGADTFRAVAGAATGTQDQTTLNSSDIIDGAAGADTIVVNMTGSNYTGGARLKNIETLQIGSNLATATFDYNINQGSNEITDVTKIVYDQINSGESLRVVNILKTNDVIPTLAWTNEANSSAGNVQADFRTSAVEGTSTTLNVQLNNVLGGVLDIGAGVETLNINSGGTSTLGNTLNVSNRDDNGAATNVDILSAGSSATSLTEGGNDDGSLKKVVVTGDKAFGKLATVVTDTTNTNFGLVNRTAGGADDLGRDTTSTAANLVSLAATVTELDASAATGDTNIRFTSRVDAAEVNVTYKGGKGNDYVEFQQGNVSATGGDGNDTFAFINTQNNSTLTTADSIVGGAGTDTIQVGVNGVGAYNLDTTEFNNKSGIDVLDLRGATNVVRLADAFVGAADAGLVVRTDKIVQTSDTNTANSSTATTNNALENNSTNTVTLTALAANRAIEFIGGSGSDRIVVNEVSLNSNVKLDGGTNLTTTGRFDTITVQDSAVLSRGDLAQVKNFEGIVLVKSDVNSARQYTIEVTEAFLNNNSGQNKTLQIGTIAAANQNALTAGDTVTIDVSDLLTTANAFKTTGYDRKIDTTSLIAAGVTVNYVANGGAVTAATLQALGLVNSTADASQALVLASAATAVSNSAADVPAVALTATSNVTGTANVDNYTAPVAAVAAVTVNGAAGTDTLTLTDAGTAAFGANVTNIERLVLANGTNTVSFNAANGFNNVTGGTGNDSVNAAALTAAALSVSLGDGNDSLTLTNGIAYTGTFAGGNGTDTLVTGAGLTNLSGATVTGFETLTLSNIGGASFGSNSLLTQFVTISGTAAATDVINIVSGSHDVSGVTITGFNDAADNNVVDIAAGATLTIAGDTQFSATNAFTNFTGAGSLITNGTLTFTAADTFTGNVTIGGTAAANFTDVAGVTRTITGNSGNNTITIDANSVAKTIALASGGNDTVVQESGTASAVATITGFTVGASQDVFDFGTTAVTATAVATTGAAIVSAAAGSATNAYILQTNAFQINGALTETGDGGAVELAILAAAMDAAPGRADTQEAYFVLDNGTDTGIYRAVFANTAGALNAANELTVTLIGQISGVTADALVAANFS